MKHIGLDVGTKTVVLAAEGPDGTVKFLSEINGYYVFERANSFVRNMLSDPSKARSDGTRRPARFIELDDRLIVLGRDAEELAFAKNDVLLRPMAEGGISPDEEAMTVLSSIVHGLLATAEAEFGAMDADSKLVYCTTAPAVNRDSNVAYHERVIDLILSGYRGGVLTSDKIKESHAIVVNESPDGTGIGISWGAGTVTVSYVKYGVEIYSFCWVGAGDLIDEQVARRHGYNPEAPRAMVRKNRETPTTVCKRKHTLDLTPGNEPPDRVGLDLVLHYTVLIDQVVEGVVQGFVENETRAKIDEPMTVYIAGGTSSPHGFELRVVEAFERRSAPFEIDSVNKSNRPLYSVAEGLLKAARMF